MSKKSTQASCPNQHPCLKLLLNPAAEHLHMHMRVCTANHMTLWLCSLPSLQEGVATTNATAMQQRSQVTQGNE